MSPGSQHPSPDPGTALRRRIAEILDQLSSLPRDELAERAALTQERDTLTAQLRALCADDDIVRRWAERAPYRPPDHGPDHGRPHIASHSEGGGSSA